MRQLIIWVSIVLSFTLGIYSQTKTINTNYISGEIGVGESVFKEIKSKNLILFLEMPYINKEIKTFTLKSKMNLEYIQSGADNTLLIGFVPFAKYNFSIENYHLFIKGGIGANYISSHKIGTRNLGGHFIFSDMISLGIELFAITNYKMEISYLFRHISNAGLYEKNPGVNFHYIEFEYVL